MKGTFINGISCISAQETAEGDFFLKTPISYFSSVIKAHKTNYKKYIRPAAMRRMSQSVKMGVAASHMALEDAKITKPDAILTGTGRGCRQDSESFMESVIYDNESFLTPLKFIQSTHNSVGGRIALELESHVYNLTYVQNDVSFQSALMDAHLLLQQDSEINNVLVGGIDELAKNSTELNKKIGQTKQEEEIHNLELLNTHSKGSLESEGASFFVLSKEKNQHSYAELLDVAIHNQSSLEDIQDSIQEFLAENDLETTEIDAVIFGYNGDSEFDSFYDVLQTGIFKDCQQLYYKHLIGEYHTSSAFAMWLAAKILKQQEVPNFLKLNEVTASKPIRKIVLYNQNLGRNHSFILLKIC